VRGGVPGVPVTPMMSAPASPFGEGTIMAGTRWSREAKAWAVTLTLLAVGVGAVVYFRRAGEEQRRREAALEYIQRTTPQEHIDNVKRAAREKTEERARHEK
jgi:hypothetical protein